MKQRPQQQHPVNRLNVFTVEEYEVSGEKKSHWTRIGVAFPHKDNGGFNVELRAFPLDGRLVLLPPKDDDDKEQEE